MNRRQRRASAAAAKRIGPTVTVTCNICRRTICEVQRRKDVDTKEAIARAVRQHNRVTGCVRLEGIKAEAIALPPLAPPPGGTFAEHVVKATEPVDILLADMEAVEKAVRDGRVYGRGELQVGTAHETGPDTTV
jgi:hypothetical protein